MSPKNLLLLSNSTLHGSRYLEWAAQHIKDFLKKHNVLSVLFIPYALTDMDTYAATAQKAFKNFGFTVKSIHEETDPVEAVTLAEAVFVGGGNTFRLLNKLYQHKLIEPLRKRVLEDGVPYIGSSAGTNVATHSICTTNDMPIVYPPSFDALGFVPFNINPHYIDPPTSSQHMGETREQRIVQYLEEPHSRTVLALREGCFLLVQGDSASVGGPAAARLFVKNRSAEECPAGDVSFLLRDVETSSS